MGHFYYVRHGQTVWNVENKICGATDIPLTPLGYEQARELGEEILRQGLKIDKILYSPLIRYERRNSAERAEFRHVRVYAQRWSRI